MAVDRQSMGMVMGKWAHSAKQPKNKLVDAPNGLDMAAGLAMLTELNNNSGIFKSINEKTEYLHKGMAKVLKQNNITHTINRLGSMISVHFAEGAVVDFETAARGNNDTFKKFFHGMLENGIYIAPSAFESWFITEALTYEDLDATIAAVDKVAKTL